MATCLLLTGIKFDGNPYQTNPLNLFCKEHKFPTVLGGRILPAYVPLRGTFKRKRFLKETVQGIRRPGIHSTPAAPYSSTAVVSSDSSLSCFSSTILGASVIRSEASFTFGNAITSRMLSQPAISMIRRSSPKASPA